MIPFRSMLVLLPRAVQRRVLAFLDGRSLCKVYCAHGGGSRCVKLVDVGPVFALAITLGLRPCSFWPVLELRLAHMRRDPAAVLAAVARVRGLVQGVRLELCAANRDAVVLMSQALSASAEPIHITYLVGKHSIPADVQWTALGHILGAVRGVASLEITLLGCETPQHVRRVLAKAPPTLSRVTLHAPRGVVFASQIAAVQAVVALGVAHVAVDGCTDALTLRAMLAGLDRGRIRSLTLTGDHSSKSEAPFYARLLAGFPALTHLSLERELSAQAPAILRGLLYSRLTSLSLRSDQIDDAAAAVLAMVLPTAISIENLTISSRSISTHAACALIKSLRGCPVLTKLDLSGTWVAAKPMTQLIALLKSKNADTRITRLALNGCGVTETAFIGLARALPQTLVRALQVADNYVADLGARELAAALPVTRIQELFMSQNPLGDAGVAAIAHVLPRCAEKALPLRVLGLTHCGVTFQCVVELARAVKSGLTALDVEEQGWTIEGRHCVAMAVERALSQ